MNKNVPIQRFSTICPFVKKTKNDKRQRSFKTIGKAVKCYIEKLYYKLVHVESFSAKTMSLWQSRSQERRRLWKSRSLATSFSIKDTQNLTIKLYNLPLMKNALNSKFFLTLTGYYRNVIQSVRQREDITLG